MPSADELKRQVAFLELTDKKIRANMGGERKLWRLVFSLLLLQTKRNFYYCSFMRPESVVHKGYTYQ